MVATPDRDLMQKLSKEKKKKDNEHKMTQMIAKTPSFNLETWNQN